MADAKDYPEALRRLACHFSPDRPHATALLRESADHIESQAAENTRLAAELERLAPRPMTITEILTVLNTRMHRDSDTWEYNKAVSSPECWAADRRGNWMRWEYAEALAEKLVREKEAARA